MIYHNDLLFEIGCEELPPNSLNTLSQHLCKSVATDLLELGFKFSKYNDYNSPRRLAFIFSQLTSQQPDQTIDRKGPALKVAFNADGSPTKAALGFAKSCGVEFSDLSTIKQKKGEWLFYQVNKTGLHINTVLPDLITKSLKSLPIAKRMRWGNNKYSFVRPVKWICCLYGNDVIEFSCYDRQSSNLSYGHRFYHNYGIPITVASEYISILEAQGKVIVDFNKRQALISEGAKKVATRLDTTINPSAALLEEVACLIEWPTIVHGKFDQQYLALPKEVLISVMQKHQRYFHLEHASGNLLADFITVANINSSQPDIVREGNERVIIPRLSDAQFFWKQDVAISLDLKVSKLDDVLFQKQLGSIGDKVKRIVKLTQYLTNQFNLDTKASIRTAYLSKADLTTEMVAEFPDLQGVMGKYYALEDDEDIIVAESIEQHYFPKFSGDILPKHDIAQCLSIADRIDTIIGIFAIDQKPTGDKDPYALRRSTIAILRIIIEQNKDIDLDTLIQTATCAFPTNLSNSNCFDDIKNFIHKRLEVYFLEAGYSPDCIEAVAQLNLSRPVDIFNRLTAVSLFKQTNQAIILASANKRIKNILNKSNISSHKPVDPSLFIEPVEHELYSTFVDIDKNLDAALMANDYQLCFILLSNLHKSIDSYFINVMIMDDDPIIKANRLATLADIHFSFLRVADISCLQL